MRIAIAVIFSISLLWMSPFAQAEATCELTPLSLPLFDGTPVARLATRSATPATEPLSDVEATEILEMYVACTNTGDPTLVWAMFTPRWFSSEFADSEEHYLPAFEYEIANSSAEVVNPLELSSVDQVDPLEDGRVAVTATFSSADMEWTDQLILANVDGQWLIDEVVLVSPSE